MMDRTEDVAVLKEWADVRSFGREQGNGGRDAGRRGAHEEDF